MAEFWFDTQEGKLIVGEAAYQQAIEQSFPGDIRSLGELLLAHDPDIQIGDYLARHHRQVLSSEERLEIGRWTLNILEQTQGKAVMLQHRHLERLHKLGLSPTPQGLYREYGGMRGYREAVGSPINFGGINGIYASMSQEELITYARNLERRFGRKLIEKDFYGDDRPSRLLIYKRFGGVGKLNARLGHFTIGEFDKDDFIYWGVTVVEANGLKRFNRYLLDFLSMKQLGPSVTSIQNRFGRLSIYKDFVTQEYDHQQEFKQEIERSKQDRYDKWFASGRLPTALFARLGSDPLGTIGKYLLVDELSLDLTTAQKVQMASGSSKNIINRLIRNNPILTAGQIEIVATSHHIFEDIWPDNSAHDKLYVTPDELAEFRRTRYSNHESTGSINESAGERRSA